MTETLDEVEQITLSEMVERYPLERGVVEIVCYRVIAGEDPRHEILANDLIQVDLNRPAQPRYVEVEQLIFQRNNESSHYPLSCNRSSIKWSDLSGRLRPMESLRSRMGKIKVILERWIGCACDDSAGYAYVRQRDED